MNSIGSPLHRLDALEKVTGRAEYAADFRPDGLLVALAYRAPTGPGRIKRIDISRASGMSGIVDVFTHEDAGRLGWTSTETINRLSGEWLGRPALADEAASLPACRPLIDDRIMFAGQWIAIVVAETHEQARAALSAIEVDICVAEAALPSPIRPGPFFAGDMQYEKDHGFDVGPERFSFEATYETPMNLHQPMEPTATTAVWNGDRLAVYDSTQGVEASRAYIAESLSISPQQVSVHSAYVGGGFGSKNQMWPHQALSAHLARLLGRPVRMQLTRADMAVASGHRSETTQHIRLGADADGRLTCLHHGSEIPTSLRGGFFEPCGLNSLILYRAARLSVSHEVLRRPIATPTPFRAPGETPGSFALETALDELAWKMNLDPVELRIRNFAEIDHYHGRKWSSNNLLECYRLGMKRFGWPTAPVPPRSLTRDGKQIGYGMAVTAYPAQALPASVQVVLQRNARLLVETSATDIGTGMRTILAQTVAEQLQIDISQIEVKLGNSDLPSSLTAGRSRSTASVIPAAQAACDTLLKKLDDVVPVTDPTSNMNDPLGRFVRSGLEELSATGRSQGVPADTPYSFYSFGAHFVEVEVDEPIARLRVTRIVSALDCGRIMNPKLAESQIVGSVIFGIGMAMMEEGIRHPASSRVLNDNLADYAVPVHADIPQIEVVFVDKPDTRMSATGARGLGEIGLPGVAAAIGNAVFHATGKRCRKLPISLDFLTRQGRRHSNP